VSLAVLLLILSRIQESFCLHVSLNCDCNIFFFFLCVTEKECSFKCPYDSSKDLHFGQRKGITFFSTGVVKGIQGKVIRLLWWLESP
jgi:hypothetical protein